MWRVTGILDAWDEFPRGVSGAFLVKCCYRMEFSILDPQVFGSKMKNSKTLCSSWGDVTVGQQPHSILINSSHSNGCQWPFTSVGLENSRALKGPNFGVPRLRPSQHIPRSILMALPAPAPFHPPAQKCRLRNGEPAACWEPTEKEPQKRPLKGLSWPTGTGRTTHCISLTLPLLLTTSIHYQPLSTTTITIDGPLWPLSTSTIGNHEYHYYYH